MPDEDTLLKDADARTITTMYARGLRFSRDGAWLIALEEKVARIWDVQSLQLVSEFLNHFDVIFSADISPDKTLAATFGADRCVRLWDAQTSKEVAQWRLANFTVGGYADNTLRFSENGFHLLLDGFPRMTVRLDDLRAIAKSRLTRTLTPEEWATFIDERMTLDQIGPLV
jgi:WD40 repeat protein